MSAARKSDPAAAMAELIKQARLTIPFDTPVARMCDGPCSGCSKKLLEFLDMELEDWEIRLHHGVVPKLGEIQKLAKRCNKIFKVLERNGLIELDNDSIIATAHA